MTLSIIVAMDRNRLIGRDNALPWHLPADLAWFKRVTMGKPLIMGRRTHESIGRPLPGRLNIVVSRDPQYRTDGCTVVQDPASAVAAAGDAPEVMVIGGARLFEAFLPLADRLYLTRIDAAFEGDTWFPDFDEKSWCEVARETRAPDEHNPCPMTFLVLERRSAA
ncbi:MAG: type 3 dihydrofolate reductase [Chromatiales bacterium]|jgi:dihydrofolate reductase|nr:type 3 dihydrofolate reductase [Chromatiales bacterium]MDX9766236.1 type 3 dihydrofolate reductase [Ectothiorhodospiraceae bacterium]